MDHSEIAKSILESTFTSIDKHVKDKDKADDLRAKAREARWDEEFQAMRRADTAMNVFNKRYETKNKVGEKKTKHRQEANRHDSDNHSKTDSDRIYGSIKRHMDKINKQENIGEECMEYSDIVRSLAESILKEAHISVGGNVYQMDSIKDEKDKARFIEAMKKQKEKDDMAREAGK